MKRKNEAYSIFIMAVLLALLCVFSGCKPSPAFTQTLYTDYAENEAEDADVSTLDNSADNTEKDSVIPPQKFEDDTGSSRDRERKNSVAGGDTPDEAAPMPENNEDAKPNEDLGESEAEPEPGAGNGGAEDEGERMTETPLSSGEGEELPTPEDSENTRKIVDAAGRTVELPETAERVAAVGEAAVMVKMLGGDGRLVASSAGLEGGLCGELFSDDSPKLWRGDGASPLSDEDFARLLEAAPQVCFEISGQTSYTEEQITALEEAGIAYVVLPALTTDSGIKLAVRVIGQVLNEYNGTDAGGRADKYLAFHDRVLELISSRTDACTPDGFDYDTLESVSASSENCVTALYISGWDSFAAYSLHDDLRETLSGTGLAVVKTGFRDSPLTYYLSLAGAANSAALTENNYSLNQPRLKYVNPIITPNKTLTIEGGLGAAYDTKYVFTSAAGTYLGESTFPAVIAANAAVKRGIEASPLWVNYGMTTSATGLTYGYGFTDYNGNIVSSTIHGAYDVFVMPCGIGNWANGSAESVLTAPWAAWKLRGIVSESEVKALISEFYENFYGCGLSESQLDEILNGESE